jgi:multidrug efflux pump
MNPSRLFIERPVATALLMLAIVLAGLLGFKLLPLSALPEVDYPTIQVQTIYPGASPDVMSRSVTAPLERQLGQMSSLQRLTSTSAAGVSTITLQFGLGRAIDAAEQEVQAAINAATSTLPADLPAPPVYAKVNPADAPVLTLAITSSTLPMTQVQSLVDTRLAQKISQVTGVGLVTLGGGQRPAVRIQADTRSLAAFGIGIDTLRTAIAAANANSAKGSFDGPSRSYNINANDQLLTAGDYRNLVVAFRDNAPVRLSDVARVVDSAENNRLAAWAGLPCAPGDAECRPSLKPAIVLDVQRQPGANVIATVDAIKQQLPQLQAGLPAAIQVDVLSDRTLGIRSSVSHVQIELALAVVMVVLVIFFFLHSLRATVIASIAVPVSLIGTCAITYLLGYSLNNLSLMALTIATGFVVDDAIVMLENISRHLKMSPNEPKEAVIRAARQIGFTIISLTVSLIAVLIPLLFMSDVVGRLFREFAVTLAITIVISAIVSLTLVPMMAARWLARESDEPRGATAWAQRGLARLIERYDTALGWVLARPGATLVVAALTLALTVLLYGVIPKGLFPLQDTGQLQARIEASQDVSFSRMTELQQAAARALQADPQVRSVSIVTGVDGVNNTMLHAGRIVINLAPDRDALEPLMQRLRDRVAAVAGVTMHLQPTQDLTVDAEGGPTVYRISLEGADSATVDTWAQRLVQQLASVPQVRHAVTDAGLASPAAFIEVDRDSASRLGISANAIDDALYSAFGQRIVSTIFSETSSSRVILEADRSALRTPQALGSLSLRASSGEDTPLSAVATIREQAMPVQVTRVAQYPAAIIGFDTADGVSLGQAVAAIREAAAAMGLPDSVSLAPIGAAAAYERSLTNQLWLILAAVVCVYIVLGVLYESFIHPLTILSTLPSAGVGALAALMLFGHELGVIAIIGLILLIGIVKKNAIMMIDFAIDAQRHEGLDALAAIRRAAVLRFRPILMTTLAALAAAIPLMAGFGEGAELRQPLGLAIFGGLILSQLLTLFTTPVIYLAFERLSARGKRTSAIPPSPSGGGPGRGPATPPQR